MIGRSIFGLFAPSPFGPMIELANKVKECADEVPVLFEAFFDGNYDQVIEISERISHLEHEADVVKTRVRDALPKSIFMPVDRRDLLDVLSSLDAVADCAEDVGILFTLRQMEAHDELVAPLKSLVRRVQATVNAAVEIVQDDLARKLFSIEDEIKPGSLLIWNKIFNKIGDMANHAEKMGNRLRLFFAA